MKEGRLRIRSLYLAFLITLAITASLSLWGCGAGKPTLITFASKNSKSAQEFKPVLDKMKKELQGKVIFKEYDFADPKNKEILKKYYVTMDPTYVVLDTKGRIKETFLGKPYEDMLRGAIMSYIQQTGKPSTSAPASSGPSVPVQPKQNTGK